MGCGVVYKVYVLPMALGSSPLHYRRTVYLHQSDKHVRLSMHMCYDHELAHRARPPEGSMAELATGMISSAVHLICFTCYSPHTRVIAPGLPHFVLSILVHGLKITQNTFTGCNDEIHRQTKDSRDETVAPSRLVFTDFSSHMADQSKVLSLTLRCHRVLSLCYPVPLPPINPLHCIEGRRVPPFCHPHAHKTSTNQRELT